MVVNRLVDKNKKTEEEIDKLILKGAPVKEDEKADDEKRNSYLNFRIPTDLLKRVDEELKERIGISRNGWILEAIQEKLRRE
jgi:hypothetical protein